MRLLNKLMIFSIAIISFSVLTISIANQNDKVRLRILLWQTPSTSIGNYLALSTLSGLIISYLYNSSSSFVKYKSVSKKVINSNYRDQYYEAKDTYEDQLDPKVDNKEKVYIERDLREPSPTMNVPFRVVGNVNIDGYKSAKNKSTKLSQNEMAENIIEDFRNDENNINDWDDIETDTW